MDSLSGHVREISRTEAANGAAGSTRDMFLHTWGMYGSADGHFHDPAGVAVSRDGTIVVADRGNHRLQCFRANGDFIRKCGSEGKGNGQFHFPTGVAIGVWEGMHASISKAMKCVPELAAFPPGIVCMCAAYMGDERIYVVDSMNHRVQVFGTDGCYRRKWGSLGYDNGQFNCPGGCCVDRNDVIYVADRFNDRIQVFDLDGVFIRKCYGSIGETSELRYPTTVCASRTGLLYVVDKFYHRIRRYRQDGTLQNEWSDLIHQPDNVLVDDDENVLYMTDRACHCILRCRMTEGGLAVLQKIGSPGGGDGQFRNPFCMAKGSDAVLYVTDRDNHRVVAMQINPLPNLL